MMLIAITGGIGSGKSAVGNMLTEKGYQVIDTDILAREVVAANTQGFYEIIKEFGESVLNTDGTINRQALAKIVFNDKEKLAKLNAITHPLIEKLLNEKVTKLEKKQRYVFVLVPLLFELNWQDRFDKVWIVLCDEEIRIRRAAKRDNQNFDEIKKRIANQLNHAEKLKFAHTVLYNNNTLKELEEQVDKAIMSLIN